MIGKRIKELRMKRGFMQLDMAERLSMGRANYSHIENERVQPQIETIQQIAEILNTTVAYLFGQTNDPSKKNVPRIKNLDIRAISRASEKMTDMQAEQLRKVAETLFPEAFKDE